MTDIEQKALVLLNEARAKHGFPAFDRINCSFYAEEALCRAIEQHEAFRQEVSDAVEDVDNRLAGDGFLKIVETRRMLAPFIIAKPDPLVEAIREMALTDATPEDADRLRAALAACGLEVRKIGEGE